MKNKIHNFDSFVRTEYSVNEGITSDIWDKAKDFGQKIKLMIREGLIKMIPSGPKKGTPAVTYFDPSQGSVLSQINSLYAGTEFARMNPIGGPEMKKIDRLENEMSPRIQEAVVPLSSPSDEFVRDIEAAELMKKIESLYRSQVIHGGDRKKANKPVFIYGAPGIGKTQIVGSVADKLGIKLLNVDLQFMSPEDFIGIPSVVELDSEDIEAIQGDRPAKVNKEDWMQRMKRITKYGAGATRSNPPLFLPRDNMNNGKGGIIFLDEANRASKRVLDALMNFVQQGRIGEYDLPTKWIIVGAGNRPQEATVTEFDFALADRFDIVNFTPNPEDWAEWAKKTAQEPTSKWPLEIINFIQKNTQWFHRLDPDELEKSGGMGGKFPTPRSWVGALQAIENQCLIDGVDSWRQLPLDEVFSIIRDNVGLGAASAIRSYLETLARFTEKDIRLMYTDPLKAPMIKEKAGLDHILYGLYFIVKKEAQIELGEDLPVEILANIARYFNRYNNHEILSALYSRMKLDFKKLELTDEMAVALDDPSNPGHEDAKLIEEIAKLLRASLQQGGVM
jgi:hypothetical protein